jgi:hypothetical protein
VATCGSCGAAIRWAITPAGKRMPIDREPVADGNVEITGHTGDGTPRVRVLGKTEIGQPTLEGDRPRFVSHFATCPNAGRHRR